MTKGGREEGERCKGGERGLMLFRSALGWRRKEVWKLRFEIPCVFQSFQSFRQGSASSRSVS